MRCSAATIPGQHAGTESSARTGWIRSFALAGLLAVAGTQIAAGPWPRGEGTAFLSLTLNAEDPNASIMAGQFETDPTLSVYGEYGLGQQFTAGLELDWGASSQMGTVFARYTLTSADAAIQVALDTGVSHRSLDGAPNENLMRVGGSLGSGFGGTNTLLFANGGWVTIDGAAFLRDDGTVSIWRTEATLGLNVSRDLRAILALKAEEWPGNTLAVTARPSLVLSVSERTSLQGGLVAGLSGGDTLGLSLSLWQEF